MLLVLAVILLLVLSDPWNWVGAAVCGLLWLVELYGWNRTVRRRRKVVGAQTLVGQTGEVRQACRPLGQVFVAGELWRAHCEEGADAGTRVEVTAVRGLTLEVVRAAR
jgi:membrane protein implicated in regulation of membrane protease activity